MSTIASTPKLIRAALDDEGGSVAMMFGLMAFTVLTFVGSAIDIGRWMQARRTTMEAIDSATLSGLRTYQEEVAKGKSANDAKIAAQAQALRNYQANVLNRGTVLGDNIAFNLVDNGADITMKAVGNAQYRTAFLAVMPSLMSVTTLPLLRMDNSEHGEAKLAAGGGGGNNTGTSLEVSLMLDVTGSMGSSAGNGQTKLQAMKDAAKAAVDIFIWADQSNYTSRVALVPFSAAINLGTSRTTTARGQSGNGAGQVPTTLSGQRNANNNNDTWTLSSSCVTERTGNERFTDASLAVAKVGPHYSSNGTCETSNAVMPLDDNKTTLKSAIDAYTASGVTAGHLGTTWAWYTLSPNFNTLWGNTKHNARPYSDLAVLNAAGKPSLKKIAVLMTDGEYNTAYCKGVADRNSTVYSASDRINCVAENGTSSSQTLALCAEMKKKGILVYTVGFMVNTTAQNMLTQCASPGEYYNATDGNELKQAFRNIAYKHVKPHVSQ